MRKGGAIRAAIFDEQRANEKDRGFLGLATFKLPESVDSGASFNSTWPCIPTKYPLTCIGQFDCKLAAMQKSTWYGPNEVTGKLTLSLAKAAEPAPNNNALTKVLSDGVANIWRH